MQSKAQGPAAFPRCGSTTNRQEVALSTTELTRVTSALARALSMDDVHEIGLDTGQSDRLRAVTPHRRLISTVAGLTGGQVESLADLLREFNHQNDVTVAYKAFYNRLARPGFTKFMHQMFDSGPGWSSSENVPKVITYERCV